MADMINPTTVVAVDALLDEGCSQIYKDESLAQDWARTAKVAEELGEAINEFILSTGQNPRKGSDPLAFDRFLGELADTALSAIYCIQHFTKDIDVTEFILRKQADKHNARLEEAKIRGNDSASHHDHS